MARHWSRHWGIPWPAHKRRRTDEGGKLESFCLLAAEAAMYSIRGRFRNLHREHADLEGSGPDYARGYRVAHSRVFPQPGAHILDGWPSGTVPIGASHMARILNGEMGRKHLNGHDYTSQDGTDRKKWPAPQ